MTTVRRRVGRWCFVWCAVGVAACSLTAPGCNRNKPIPRPQTVEPVVTRDVPTPLRGTIGSVARLGGTTPTRVSGIGFVVGLDGTGGLPLQEQFAAHLEREMSLMGVGQPGRFQSTAIEGVSPRQLLADRNTAAVIVEAAVPPGAGKGDAFDVYVRALNATSLEGGVLWTTELRVGPPSAFGNAQARVVGSARGPIFLNPFAEPGAEGAGVRRTVGRVLDGGASSEEFLIDVVLDTPSHARARQIASAINSRFPRGDGDREPTARGSDEQLVRVRVPYRYRDRAGAFAELVRHLPIDQSYPEVYARRFASTLQTEPGLAGSMSWSLEAVGERALPFVRELYEFPEAAPRLAALRAGAGLGDPRAGDPLLDLAMNGPVGLRADAIRLLSDLEGTAKVEQTLAALATGDDLVVRVAAYEALAERATQAQRRRLRAMAAAQPGSAAARLSMAALDTVSRSRLPDGTIHRVSRELVADKFFLDRVPGGTPLIYVTQQGEPRIVLFGPDQPLPRPMLAGAWTDRLLLAADSESEPIRVLYRDDRRGVTVRGELEGTTSDLIEFLAHSPTPEDPRPGLGLSYSEVVGALYEFVQQGVVAEAFTTERDRLLAELLRSQEGQEIEYRPETPQDESDLVLFGELDDPRAAVVRPGQETPRRRSLLVPLRRPTPDGEVPADRTPDRDADEPEAREE